MKTLSFCAILMFSSVMISQEVFLHTQFPSRDFFIKNDTINFIEKRDILITPSQGVKSYFIGGYGLEIYDNSENNEIISVSNELRNTVCSVRFFDKSSQQVEEVYYYTKARALDAVLIKEENLVALSLNDKKIVIVDYSKKPAFSIKAEINLKNTARRLFLHENDLYFGTDGGNLYQYNLKTLQRKLLLSCKEKITDLVVYENAIIYSTISGNIVKWNRDAKNETKIKLKDNLVLTSLVFNENKLILGTFNGAILVLNADTMKIEEEFSYHKRSILKIYKDQNDYLYSSSIDKTIKKWKLD